MLLTAPASAAGERCEHWVSNDEGMVADLGQAGYRVTFGDGTTTQCADRSAGPNTLARIADCDSGWSGLIFFSGSSYGVHDQGIMVLMNSVFFRRCQG